MKLTVNKFNFGAARLILSALMIVTLIITPSGVFAAEKDKHEDRAEVRIKEMHDKLKITAAQEAQWAKVEQAMRDDAKTMDALTQARADHAKELTAIEDLKSYGEIAETHAAGIKKLTPIFTVLYEDMSVEQKQAADILFRDGHHEGHHKQGYKKMDDK